VNAGATLLKENLPALPIGIVRVCRSSFKLVNGGHEGAAARLSSNLL
jgi:hypothetical protein